MVIEPFSNFNSISRRGSFYLPPAGKEPSQKKKYSYKVPLLTSVAGTAILTAIPVYKENRNINFKFANYAKKVIAEIKKSPEGKELLNYYDAYHYEDINYISEYKYQMNELDIYKNVLKENPENLDIQNEYIAAKLRAAKFNLQIYLIKKGFKDLHVPKVFNSIVKYNTIGLIPMFVIPAAVDMIVRKVRKDDNNTGNK